MKLAYADRSKHLGDPRLLSRSRRADSLEEIRRPPRGENRRGQSDAQRGRKSRRPALGRGNGHHPLRRRRQVRKRGLEHLHAQLSLRLEAFGAGNRRAAQQRRWTTFRQARGPERLRPRRRREKFDSSRKKNAQFHDSHDSDQGRASGSRHRKSAAKQDNNHGAPGNSQRDRPRDDPSPRRRPLPGFTTSGFPTFFTLEKGVGEDVASALREKGHT